MPKRPLNCSVRIPTTLFMDVHMPNIDGMQAAQSCVNEIKQPYIVALTADAFPETRRQAMMRGWMIVTKPLLKWILPKPLNALKSVRFAHISVCDSMGTTFKTKQNRIAEWSLTVVLT